MMDIDQQLFVMTPLGAGVLLVGILHVLLPKLPWSIRWVASGAILALAFLTSSNLSQIEWLSWIAPTVFATVVVLTFYSFIRSRSVQATSSKPVSLKHALATCGLGIAIIAASSIIYEIRFENKLKTELDDFELLSYIPIREIESEYHLVTDRGRVIPLMFPKNPVSSDQIIDMERRCLKMSLVSNRLDQLNRIGLPTDVSNCHGWVFTAGRSIISGHDVEFILEDNNYRKVDEPHVGDLVVYRTEDAITHTGLVSSIEGDGKVIVDSKWSWMGVYRHEVSESIYGSEFEYYRTSRPNHLVKIVELTPANMTGAE